MTLAYKWQDTWGASDVLARNKFPPILECKSANVLLIGPENNTGWIHGDTVYTCPLGMNAGQIKCLDHRFDRCAPCILGMQAVVFTKTSKQRTSWWTCLQRNHRYLPCIHVHTSASILTSYVWKVLRIHLRTWNSYIRRQAFWNWGKVVPTEKNDWWMAVMFKVQPVSNSSISIRCHGNIDLTDMNVRWMWSMKTCNMVKCYDEYIQVVPRRAGGGSFRRKKNYIAKQEFAHIKAADQLVAQAISLLWTSLLLFHHGVVTCFDVMKLLAGWDEVMWLVVRWRGVSYCG